MPTNGEVLNGLEGVETGFFIPGSKDKSGNPIEVKLKYMSSIIAFKKLPTNDAIKVAVAHNEKVDGVTPTNIEKSIDIDLSVDDTIFTDKSQRDQPFNSDYMFVGLNIAARKKEPDADGAWGQFHDMEFKTPTYKFAFMTNDKRFRGCYITDILKNTVDSSSANISDDYFVDMEEKQPGMFLDESDENVKKLAVKGYPKYVKRYRSELVKNADSVETVVEDGKVISRYTRDLRNVGADTFIESSEDYEAVVRENQQKYRRSAELFIQEYQIIQPKHLIVLGKKAQQVVQNMRADGLFENNPEVARLADTLIEAQHYSRQGKKTSTLDYMNYLQTLLKKTDVDAVNE
ncbi:hypothetical protein [Levilactobacillus fuyuanensis]|uniref:Uncharacterized protein n=1 Tax=Levilactobacillus fuyuanensis TaxID=2486022 RepID=A0ABW4H372_9LACO|nr:hypothetical protein [Levilactobacillus fuyuanensis]